MEYHDIRRFTPEATRHAQMDTSGIDITEVMDSESRGMTDHGDVPTPQRPSDQMVVIGGRPLRQTEQPSVEPLPVTMINVELLRLVAVADRDSLPRGEVPVLLPRQVPELVPQGLPISCHEEQPSAANYSFTLVWRTQGHVKLKFRRWW